MVIYLYSILWPNGHQENATLLCTSEIIVLLIEAYPSHFKSLISRAVYTSDPPLAAAPRGRRVTGESLRATVRRRVVQAPF
jgi:hypothetical protein